MNTVTTPVIIIVRDRLKPLALLVDWLERAGAQRLVLLDNDSTYPPLVSTTWPPHPTTSGCWGATSGTARRGSRASPKSWAGPATTW
jgi:hypothetical protein